MSGIFGVVNFDGSESHEEKMLEAMTQSSRGTGAEEIRKTFSNGTGIGISSGRAEGHWICGEDLAVAADGELYGSDAYSIAEGVAQAYRLYGDECAAHLDGKFSFCLWDKRKKTLLVATDRFGSGVINYYLDDRRFMFASKIRALIDTSVFSPEVDRSAVYSYCVFTFVPAPRTIYSRIKKMLPGHVLKVKSGKVEERKYWDITYDDGSEVKEESYYCRRIRDELEGAVRRRFDVSADDGRTGAFLSGGLDSSAVAGLMRNISGREVKTFSIGFDEPGYSEIEYIDIAARHFGLKSHKYIVRPKDLFPAIEALVGEYDEPYGNSSAIAAYYCMKMAKDSGVDVLLGGDGGDENFAGYERYVKDKVFSVYQRLPLLARKRIIEPWVFSLKKVPFFEKAGNYINHSNLPRPERFCFYELYPMRSAGDIFTRDFIDAVDPLGPLGYINDLYNTPRTRFSLNRLMYLDSHIGLIGNDLRNKMDKVSRVTGVGVRFPMLDVRLWDLAGSIPPPLKLKGFRRKHIYRRAVEDLLPEKIMNKKKHGFGLPFALWLREDRFVRKYTEDILLDPSSGSHGYFKKGFFEQMLKMHDNELSSYYGDLLWPFLMFEVWHKRWVERR
jgi:asparagine synthase (glutamine-hydrolysing)